MILFLPGSGVLPGVLPAPRRRRRRRVLGVAARHAGAPPDRRS
jgi:hypothetical protein